MSLETYLEELEVYTKGKKKKKINQTGDKILAEFKNLENVEKGQEIVKKLEDSCLPFKIYSVPVAGYQLLGKKYLNLKRFDKAEEYFMKAQKISTEDKKAKLNKEILKSLDSLLVTTKDYESAITYYKNNIDQLAKDATKPEKEEELIDNYIQYGEVLLFSGQKEEAIENLLKAKEMLDKRFNLFSYCKMLNYLGQSMYLANKKPEETVGYLYDSMTIATNEALPHRLVHSLYIKGMLHLKMSQFFEAKFNLGIAQTLGDAMNINQFKTEISRQLMQAEMGFKVSTGFSEAEAKKMVTQQAESDLRVAKKYLLIEEWKKADDLLTKCIKTFIQLDDLNTVAEVDDLIKTTRIKGKL